MSERALVLSNFRLTGRHNYGKELRSALLEYYDLRRAEVSGVHVAVFEPGEPDLHDGTVVAAGDNLIGRPERLTMKDASGNGLIRKALEPLYPGFGQLRVQLDVHPALREVAERVVAQGIPEQAAWVHVRPRRPAADHRGCDYSSEHSTDGEGRGSGNPCPLHRYR